MKYTAPTLANERFGIKLIFPHDPRYYHASHRREDVECLWIEVKRIGHVFCYPYAIYDHGRVLEFGDPANPANRERNESLIKRWNQIITPDNLNIDWTWERIEEDAFRHMVSMMRDIAEGDKELSDGDKPQLGDGERRIEDDLDDFQ